MIMIYSLSHSPNHQIRVLNTCSINGFHFRTKHVEKHLTTQNSGVLVKGDDMEWYRVINRIIMLDFANEKEVTLFDYDWFYFLAPPRCQSRGYSKDQYGIIDIDTTRTHYADEPYIMATQAEQVCYLKSAKKANWCSVLRMKPRNLFAMPEGEEPENNVITDDDSLIIGLEHMNLKRTR